MPSTSAGHLTNERCASPPSPTTDGVTTPHAGDRRGTESSGMRMNCSRTPPAALPDLTGPPVAASPWRWSAAEPEPSGRLLLTPVARRVLGADGGPSQPVSGSVRGDTLVLRPHHADGRAMTVDGRGRMYLPVWLRRQPGFLIGTNTTPDVAVVVVPAALFDAIGDQLLARVR